MNPAPAPFRILPGAGTSPVILHVPHSSRVIPESVRGGILLDDRELERELDHITDSHTADIAAAASAAAAVTPWRFVNGLSRLVVDPERFPDEREEMLAVGMGAVYTRTTHRERLRADGFDGRPLVDRYFHPYADAMARAVGDRLETVGRAVIIDVHSYPSEPLPYELHGAGPRPRSAWARTPSTPRPASSPRPRRPSRASAAPGSTAPSPVRTCRSTTTPGTGGSAR